MLRILTLCLLFAQVSFAQTAHELEFFNGLNLRGNIEVTLVPGETSAITIEPGEKHRVVYSIQDDKLYIKHQNLLSPSGWEDCAVHIQVEYTELRSIKALAGAEVETEGTIKGLKCDLHFASGAMGELDMEVAKSNLVLKQGAELEINGVVQSLSGKVITGGELDAFAMDCQKARLKVSTGGEACITASEKLDAIARTGGCLIYNGDPAEVVVNYSLWGTVNSRRN